MAVLLSSAVFAVYDSADKKLADLATNTDGLAEMYLAAGSDYLKEIKAPEGIKHSYGLDMEDGLTAYALCNSTLEPSIELACVLLEDWNRLNGDRQILWIVVY